ncbi:MAG: amidohydrolase family protein [Phycisphaerales bacterium]
MTDSDNTGWTELRDAHLHLLNHGKALAAVQLADCTSVADVLDRVRGGAALPEHRGVRRCGSMREGCGRRVWRMPLPDACRARRGQPGRPAVLKSFDYHALMGNTPALLEAGIEASTVDPPAGVIVRDGSGVPTGVLLESACNAMYAAQPVDTSAQRSEQLRLAIDDLRCAGSSRCTT